MHVPLDFAEVHMKTALTGDTEPFVTSFGIRAISADFSQTDADAISTVCANFWLSNSYGGTSGAFIPSQGSYLGVSVAVGPSGIGPLFDSAVNAGGGAGTTTLLTQNTTYLVKKSTGLGGRKNRGRWYLPFVREANVNDVGTVDGATMSYLQDRVDQFLIDIPALGSPVGVIVLLHTLEADDPANLTAMPVDGRVATQRRRLRR